MKKNVIAIVSLLLAAVIALCAGCGPKTTEEKIPEPGSLDVTELAKSIYEGCKFDDNGLEASPNSEFVVVNVYGVDAALIAGDDGAKKAAVYNSSASPEMVICIEAVDVDSARQIMEGALAAMLEDYITNYTNYGPEEVSKLTSAVKEQRGTYVILAVTADNANAETVIGDLLSK